MTVHSAATAIDYINQIQQKNLKTAAIRHNMTKPGSGTFMDWIVQETKDLQALSDTQPSDQLLNDDATKERFQQYYEVFIHLEKTFNPIAPPSQFGTTLTKKIVKEISTDAKFVTQFLDMVSLDKRQDFEKLVYSAIPRQVQNNNDAKGLRDFLADLPPNVLSPSTMDAMDAFFQTLDKVEMSTRFEILARVDAYIRSGWARHDLESDSPSTAPLRDALFELSGQKKKNPQTLHDARLALFTRFDQLFRIMKIKDGMAIDQGVFSVQPDYKAPSDNILPACMRTAQGGTVDVVIQQCGNTNEWLWSIVTATYGAEQLSAEGEQTERHYQASQNIVFEYGDTYKKLSNQQVDVSLVYPALVNAQKKSCKFSQAVGASNLVIRQSINDLIPLAMVSNCADPSSMRQFRMTCIGAPSNHDLEHPDADARAKVASEQIITALSSILSSAPDAKLVMRSKMDESIRIASQLLASHDENPYLLASAPIDMWLGQFETFKQQVTSGDFNSLKQLKSNLRAFQGYQQEYQDKSHAQISPSLS